MAGTTRGFFGRSRAARDPRLPPGQYDARDDWPVLHAEATPTIGAERWTFTVDGLVERQVSWTGTPTAAR
jgi:DMSO/TMAO reductase YedYZ molybdopterin-dependent catalytic subunit